MNLHPMDAVRLTRPGTQNVFVRSFIATASLPRALQGNGLRSEFLTLPSSIARFCVNAGGDILFFSLRQIAVLAGILTMQRTSSAILPLLSVKQRQKHRRSRQPDG